MSVPQKYSKFIDEHREIGSFSPPHLSTSKTPDSSVAIPSIPLKDDDLMEEACSSLWQYCIQDPDNTRNLEILMPIFMLIFYALSFYASIRYLLVTPAYQLSNTGLYYDGYALVLCKWVFMLVLCIQAECECYDGWRIYLLADGYLKRILFFGTMQYVSGCFVELISFSFINRSANILNIMTYSAILTVFLRIDDLFMIFINKFLPKMTKKITFNKQIPSKRFLFFTMAIKLMYFVIAEFLYQSFEIQIFI